MKLTLLKKALFLGIIALLIPTVVVYTMQETNEDVQDVTMDEPTDDNDTMPASTDESMDTAVEPEEIDVDEIEVQAPKTPASDMDDADDNDEAMDSEFTSQEQPMEEEQEEITITPTTSTSDENE